MSSDDAFGHWLSGFCDGEATFCLKATPRRTQPGALHLALREDDHDTLVAIRDYFGCGSLRRALKKTSRPQTVFCVDTLQGNVNHVLPHFDRYPLRSKKRRDYEVYRRAVLLRRDVDRRMYAMPRWKPEDVTQFLTFKRELEEGRVFRERVAV